ncbi:response regulator [Spirosoma pulveris]
MRPYYMKSKPTSQVLLVDDDPDYTFLVETVFNFARFDTHIQPIHQGEELLAWLGAHPVPNLILLDLRMPTLSGFDLLTLLRKDDAFKEVPIVILTISSDHADRQKCYALGATDYIIKPRSFESLQEQMHRLSHYWLN